MTDLQTLIAERPPLTLDQMGERLGLTRSQVRHRLKAAGLKPPRKHGQRSGTLNADETRALVDVAAENGWSQARAAEHVGVAPLTLKRHLKRHGVPWWRARNGHG